MVKKKAYTMVETLMASGIFAMVLTIGIAIIYLINATLFDGQIENTNRSNLNDTLFYLTREIQSAEDIKISTNGKELKIKQRGSGEHSLVYTLIKHYPVDYLAFKGRRMIDADYDTSCFYKKGASVGITLNVYKNNIQSRQIPQEVKLEVLPRSAAVSVGVME